MYARNAANTYAKIGVQTGAMSASPQQLITMLYDGACGAIARAKFHMADGNIADKGKAIGHAMRIIDNGLRASLDHEAGGDISASSEQLYEYMSRRLFRANLNNDATILEEVDRLLENLASASAQIAATPQPVAMES